MWTLRAWKAKPDELLRCDRMPAGRRWPQQAALESVGACVKAERSVAFRKSRFMRAMNSWLMSFGQTAEHS